MKDREKQIERKKPKYMLYSEREALAEEYEKWVNQPLQDGSKIKDCPLSVITFMQTKGWAKLPEDSVVLTREEYDNMFSFKTTRGGFYNILDTVRKVERKETAEEFLQLAYDRTNDKFFIKKVEELAKQFNVEIKE